MKKILFCLAAAAVFALGQSIYVPDSGTALVETMVASDPSSSSPCTYSVKALNYNTGHEWGCIGAPGSQTWTDLTSVAPTSSVVNSNPPATSSSPGVTGTLTWDSNYIYVAVAPNTWKRVGLSSF